MVEMNTIMTIDVLFFGPCASLGLRALEVRWGFGQSLDCRSNQERAFLSQTPERIRKTDGLQDSATHATLQYTILYNTILY